MDKKGLEACRDIYISPLVQRSSRKLDPCYQPGIV